MRCRVRPPNRRPRALSHLLHLPRQHSPSWTIGTSTADPTSPKLHSTPRCRSAPRDPALAMLTGQTRPGDAQASGPPACSGRRCDSAAGRWRWPQLGAWKPSNGTVRRADRGAASAEPGPGPHGVTSSLTT